MSPDLRSVASLVLAGLAVAECAHGPGSATAPDPGPGAAAAPPTTDPALTAFDDCTGLVAHLRDLARPHVTARGFGTGIDRRTVGGGWTEPAAPPSNVASGPPRDLGVLFREGGDDGTSLTGPEGGPAATATTAT